MVVTGGRGFIGTNFINKYGGESFDIKDGEDIRDHIQTDTINQDIVHLAAESGIPFSIEKPRRSFDANVCGTFNVLEAARRHNKKVILASSAAADNCLTPYASYKRSTELMAKAYHETYGLQYTVLRFANVYGPHSMHKTSVVAQMCRDALTKGEITVNGDCSRDFIHVDDVCLAIKAAMEADYNGVLYIGSGTVSGVWEIANFISKRTGSEIIIKDKRRGDIEEINDPVWDYVLSTGDYIDWEPEIKLEQGILDTLEWFRENI